MAIHAIGTRAAFQASGAYLVARLTRNNLHRIRAMYSIPFCSKSGKSRLSPGIWMGYDNWWSFYFVNIYYLVSDTSVLSSWNPTRNVWASLSILCSRPPSQETVLRVKLRLFFPVFVDSMFGPIIGLYIPCY